MARTIHDTLGVADRAMHADWSDDEIPEVIASEMRRNWMRQQAIRDGERRLRRRGARSPQPVDPERVPIIVEPGRNDLFHAIDVEDMREVLRCLPPGSLDGLQEVRLCAHPGNARRRTRPVDPLTGKVRNELVPGWYSPSPLGKYNPRTATIRVFGWFRDGEDPGPLFLYLKVDQLKTLVHEAAHHFDHTFRKGRHRWDVNDKEKHEDWARRIESDQALEIIAPVVERRHSSRCEELAQWIEEHAGVAIDPLLILCLAETAFLALVRAAFAGEDRDAARVACARALHHVGGNDEARAIAAGVLSRRPEDAGALAVTACILQCEGRDQEAAEDLIRRAVAADPTCMDAWDVLVRGHAMRRKWEQAAVACEGALSQVPAGERPRWYFISTLAEAHLHLRDSSGMEADVARMRAWGDRDAARQADVHLVLASSWSEQWEKAFSLASRLLAAGKHGDWKDWLVAARFEAAHRLGRPEQAGRLAEADIRALESRAFTEEWGRRIRRHVDAAAPR